jgi:hypothetical protein
VTKKKTPQSVWIAAVVAGLLFVTVVGYFVVVSPQRGQAASLQQQIDATQKQINAAHALIAKAKNAQKVKVADLFKLTKAMPDAPDEAGVLLDLTNVARASGIEFASINVLASAALPSYQVIPLQVEFDGNFYSLSDFLFRLRNLVDVRRGALDATGRLFAIDNIALDEGAHLFPRIRAQIKIDAFVYGTGSPSAVAPAQSTATTTPGTRATTPSSSSASRTGITGAKQ